MSEFVQESVEEEDLGANEYPFDPSKIDIATSQQPVFNLVERMRNDEINLTPEFQRYPDLWKADVQSRLIESLILGIPLQAFYFDVQKRREADLSLGYLGRRDVWNVVDGLQRLSSIRNFVIGGQRLRGLEYLKTLDGKTFDELPSPLQRSILESTVLIYLIKDGTPEDIKFNIFKRVNTGGMPLTQQEIRQALFCGKGTFFISHLAELDEFRRMISFARNRRMLDREFLNRYLAFLLLDVEESYRSMDLFLNDAVRLLNRLNDRERKDVEEITRQTLILVEKLLGERAFRRYKQDDRAWSLSVNKALFEVTMAGLARLSAEHRDRLLRLSTFAADYQALFGSVAEDGLSFDLCVAKSTGDRKRVLGRHRIFAAFLRSCIEKSYD